MTDFSELNLGIDGDSITPANSGASTFIRTWA